MGGVETVQNKLRGESGTSVNVSWLDSENAQHTADLTHSGYSSTTVDYQMVQGNVATSGSASLIPPPPASWITPSAA